MLLLDLSHTSHTRARTGIQRVARSLHAALDTRHEAQPVTWDPHLGHWRTLAAWELDNFSPVRAPGRRSTRWPWRARWGGRFGRWFGRTPALPSADGLIMPELFSDAVARALPKLSAVRPQVALFHDAVALKLPELTPPGTVARFPAYLQDLLQFDGIAAISEDARATLLDYWRWLGVSQMPPVTTIPLGSDVCNTFGYNPAQPGMEPTVLSVGSIEGRKNHLALLEACESLWSRQRRFQLRLIGLTQPQTGRAARQKIFALQQAGRPVIYEGAVAEPVLQQAYAECAFTVYPSLMEGFGLPVQESLLHGKPCVCSAQGATGELARAGGCLTVPAPTTAALAEAMDTLMRDATTRNLLASEAHARKFPSWDDYAQTLLAWMQTLR